MDERYIRPAWDAGTHLRMHGFFYFFFFFFLSIHRIALQKLYTDRSITAASAESSEALQ